MLGSDPRLTNAPATGRGPSAFASTMVPEMEMPEPGNIDPGIDVIVGYDAGKPALDNSEFDTMSTSNVRVGSMLSQTVPDGQGAMYGSVTAGAMLTNPPFADAEYRPPVSLVAVTMKFSESTTSVTAAAGRSPSAVYSKTVPEILVAEGPGGEGGTETGG